MLKRCLTHCNYVDKKKTLGQMPRVSESWWRCRESKKDRLLFVFGTSNLIYQQHQPRCRSFTMSVVAHNALPAQLVTRCQCFVFIG
jgi:hypothetical protein